MAFVWQDARVDLLVLDLMDIESIADTAVPPLKRHFNPWFVLQHDLYFGGRSMYLDSVMLYIKN